MKNYVMKVENLSKSYNKTTALNNVSFALEKGKIYGFIGQNGAGKTTLIRMITGLCFPDEGEIEIFNESGRKGLEKARKRIGCMVEHSALYPNLTAEENLILHSKFRAIGDKGAIKRTLKTVGLDGTGKKKFKDFSMGMKQRLGIAAALLGDPELLILDEPTNGLDPMGIVEIREMLLDLNKERNITILISSHILSELYMLATNYIIIDKGVIVDTLTLAQLHEKCRKHIVIEVNDPEGAINVLKNKLTDSYCQAGNRIQIFDEKISRETLARTFHESGLILIELSYAGKSLETFFIELIGGTRNA